MGKVQIYFFKGYDRRNDRIVRSQRPATLEAIKRAKGEPLMDMGFEVDEAHLDGDGFLKKELKTKECRECGEAAVLKPIRPPDALFSGEGGAMPDPLKENLGWECPSGHIEWSS